MKSLKISDDLKLPLDAVTEKLAFLGRTGTGKTYAAMKLAELMLEAGAQIVALDFVGKWYGLRVPGAGEPFTIPVFGGLQGDYPLEPTGGALVADLIVDRNISTVLDVSQFTRGEQVRFCLAFAQQFFQRKKAAPSAVHLFLEECQEVLPQNAGPNEAEMLGAFERVWKLGRNFGIGGSLISQRPQEVNKKALNMSGTLFVFQMTGPQERKTIEQWVSAQGINEDIADILPKLGKGQPHVWSVALGDLSKTVRIAEKRTADVSATPTLNASRKERPLTPIDVPALTEAMAATVERSKENDPKALRRMVAQLKAEKAQLEKQTAKPVSQPTGKTKDVPVLTDADRTLLERQRFELFGTRDALMAAEDKALTRIVERAHAEIDTAAAAWRTDIERRRREFAAELDGKRFSAIIDKLDRVIPQNAPVSARPAKNIGVLPRSRPTVDSSVVSGNGHLPPARGRILGALLWLESIHVHQPERTQLALWTGVSPSSGSYFNNLGALRTDGLIDYPNSGTVQITDAGRTIGAPYQPDVEPTADAIQAHTYGLLPPAKAQILRAAIKAYPKALTREELAESIGVSPTSGSYFNNLGSLRTLGLLTYPKRGFVAAAPVLFLE